MKPYGTQKNRHHLSECLFFFIVIIFFFLSITAVEAYDLTLQWDPNSEPDVAGYVLYIDDGTSGPDYEYFDTYPLEDIDPDNPSCIITGLQNDHDYYFALTAYDADGNESDLSDDICVNNGMQCASSINTGGSSTPASSGGGGGGCFISSSVHKTPTHGTFISWLSYTLSFSILIASILWLLTKKKLLGIKVSVRFRQVKDRHN
jgi:hypothetical protein